MDSSSNNIYGGDLINVGGAAVTYQGEWRSTCRGRAITGLYDTRCRWHVGTPSQSGYSLTLSTTADAGFIDLIAAPVALVSGGTWMSAVDGTWGNRTIGSTGPSAIARQRAQSTSPTMAPIGG